ncbi:hypothetical protein CHU98_g9914 [Xylaria longipes]|nr:hypothetical protein CHU98_g9914 [Xylaria longipes]
MSSPMTPPGLGTGHSLLLLGAVLTNADDDDDDDGRAARVALLRSVLEFDQPSAEEVGGQTAGFWRVFRGFAEQLMKAEERL